MACENKEANEKYEAFYRTNLSEDKQCREFEESLEKKYIVSTDTEDVFVKDEAKALEAINGFRMEFTSRKRAKEASRLIQTACSSEESSGWMISCPSGLEYMTFFSALLKAASSYSWSPETKKKAAALAGKYVRSQLSQPQDLLSVSILADLMRRIQDHGFMEKDISSELAPIEEGLMKLRQERKSSLKNSCQEALKKMDEEAAIGEQYLQKLKKLEPALP